MTNEQEDTASVPDATNAPCTPEVYLELAKMAQASFFNRRATEWKVAFGTWAAIGLITYFSVEHSEALSPLIVVGFGVLYFVLFVVWFVCWQVPLRRAFEVDKRFKHYYMHRAEGRPANWPGDGHPTCREIVCEVFRWDTLGWNYGQTAITAIFLIGSFMVIFATSSRPSSDDVSLEFQGQGGLTDSAADANR